MGFLVEPTLQRSVWGNHKSWRELYYDNATSLDLKYDLVHTSKLLGTGRLALGYDGTSADLWNELSLKFVSHWQSLGGMLSSGPGAATWGSGRLDVFVRGPITGSTTSGSTAAAGAVGSRWGEPSVGRRRRPAGGPAGWTSSCGEPTTASTTSGLTTVDRAAERREAVNGPPAQPRRPAAEDESTCSWLGRLSIWCTSSSASAEGRRGTSGAVTGRDVNGNMVHRFTTAPAAAGPPRNPLMPSWSPAMGNFAVPGALIC